MLRDDAFYKDSLCADAPQTPQHMHQPLDCDPERVSVLEDAVSTSTLNPTCATFIPQKLNDGSVPTARHTLPHKEIPELHNLGRDSSTTLSNVKANIRVSIAAQETPDQRMPRKDDISKAQAPSDADPDLIVLYDELGPAAAMQQYSVKETRRRAGALPPIDHGLPQPIAAVEKASKDSINETTAPSSIDELRELQTEVPRASVTYDAPAEAEAAIKTPTQIWLDRMYNEQSSLPESSAPSPNPSLPQQALNAKHETTLVNERYTMSEHKIDVLGNSNSNTTAASKAPTTTPSTDSAPPKDKVSNSAAFMAAATAQFSAFEMKYGKDPELSVRKDLAAKGQALKAKIASEAGTSLVNTTPHAPEEHDDASNIAVYTSNATADVYPEDWQNKHGTNHNSVNGSHVLGSLLDDASRFLVIRPGSRGDWFEPSLDWKPVMTEGRVCYRL